MDDKVGRVLFIKDYASFLEEDMIASMADVSKNIMLSIDILPIPTDEAGKRGAEQAAFCGDGRNQMAEKAE